MAEKIPVALTIAGSDSGGGAGVEADLRAFWAHGVHGCAAITAVTAQNPFGVGLVQGMEPEVLRDQLAHVAEAFDLRAVKTGMLLNAALIGVVADFAAAHPGLPLVVDPVMVATSGARLLDEAAVTALRPLLRRATLITPNLPEAAALLGRDEAAVAAAPCGAARDLFDDRRAVCFIINYFCQKCNQKPFGAESERHSEKFCPPRKTQTHKERFPSEKFSAQLLTFARRGLIIIKKDSEAIILCSTEISANGA